MDLREKPDGAPCLDDDSTKKVHLNVLVYHDKMNPIEFCDSITAFEDFLEWYFIVIIDGSISSRTQRKALHAFGSVG